MKRFIIIVLIFSVFALIIGCSGSKATDEPEVTFADPGIQDQVDVLKDKIEDNPNQTLYRQQLAELYSENGEKLEAMRTLEKAFVIDPSDGEMKYLYAEIATELGDKLKAYRAYKDVLQSADGMTYLDRISPKFVDAFQVTKIVGGPADEAFGNFSAEGNKVVYQTYQAGNWDIYQYNIADGYSDPVIVSPAHEENPDFAPDGSAVVYTSTRDDHRDVDYNQKLRDIFLYDFPTKKVWNLTTNGSNDWRPRYSYDGEYIAFVSERNDLRDLDFYELNGSIFVMENDGRFQVGLTSNEFNTGSPCIAPGSTEENGTIYYDSDENGNFAIYKMDFKGENVRQITFNQGVDDVSPDISASGDKIVFFSNRDGNFELYMMNSDGSAQQRLTSNSSDDLNPVFSPDGTKVLFHSNRNGNYDIYLLDLSEQSSDPTISEVISNIDKAILQLQ